MVLLGLRGRAIVSNNSSELNVQMSRGSEDMADSAAIQGLERLKGTAAFVASELIRIFRSHQGSGDELWDMVRLS